MTQNIIQELGLETLPQEKQEEIILKIGDIINQKILIRVLDEMSEDQKDLFEKFLADNKSNQGAIFEYLHSHIDGFDTMAREEIESFKKSGMDFIQNI